MLNAVRIRVLKCSINGCCKEKNKCINCFKSFLSCVIKFSTFKRWAELLHLQLLSTLKSYKERMSLYKVGSFLITLSSWDLCPFKRYIRQSSDSPHISQQMTRLTFGFYTCLEISSLHLLSLNIVAKRTIFFMVNDEVFQTVTGQPPAAKTGNFKNILET